MVPAAMDSNRKARNRPPEERGGFGGGGHKEKRDSRRGTLCAPSYLAAPGKRHRTLYPHSGEKDDYLFRNGVEVLLSKTRFYSHCIPFFLLIVPSLQDLPLQNRENSAFYSIVFSEIPPQKRTMRVSSPTRDRF
ncbi:hypothetical protein CEXT_518551 [Caerostris extrusa]|uniref:Uncharacterized protein n=1 Tax=Caerostris extrusa TaxID=172846 RepID=A0AAV4TYX1_CAEEX|nr:hypothetical protein CEXT_518551 [Caerostris extrusa]